MNTLTRLRIQREVMKSYLDNLAKNGGDQETATEEMMVEMKERYESSVEWAKIIEIIMTILALFLKS